MSSAQPAASAQPPGALSTYGGQAVIEGVMMRGRTSCKVAVRAPDHSIQVEDLPLPPLYQSRWATLPFLRGLLVLWDALGLGMRALTFSANVQAGEEARIEGAPLALTMAASLLVGAGLFFLLPAGGAYLAEQLFTINSNWSNLLEGLVRLALLVGYVWAIGLLPDVRRVFGYHGAEHMTINAYEAGAPLDVASVRQFSRQHPRCGTAFLLTVVVFSVVLFSLLGDMGLLTRSCKPPPAPASPGIGGLRVHTLDGALRRPLVDLAICGTQFGPAILDHPPSGRLDAGSGHRRLPGHEGRRA